MWPSKKKQSSPLGAISEQGDMAAFKDWLGRVSRAETPPNTVVAYNVGPLETSGCYSDYLVGANSYDEEDSDWACEESFTPRDRYFPISDGGFAGWLEVHSAVVKATREFIQSPAGKDSFLAHAQALTVGFDDGDLEIVK